MKLAYQNTIALNTEHEACVVEMGMRELETKSEELALVRTSDGDYY